MLGHAYPLTVVCRMVELLQSTLYYQLTPRSRFCISQHKAQAIQAPRDHHLQHILHRHGATYSRRYLSWFAERPLSDHVADEAIRLIIRRALLSQLGRYGQRCAHEHQCAAAITLEPA